MGVIISTMKDSLLGRMLANCGRLRQDGLRKKINLILHTAWPQIGEQEIWSENGLLNYNAILQLDVFYKKEGK